MPRGVDQTWSASVALPSAAGRLPGDGVPGSQAAGPRDCGTTARATRRRRKTRCGVKVDRGSTTPSVSITWRFARRLVVEGDREALRSVGEGEAGPARALRSTGMARLTPLAHQSGRFSHLG